MRSSADVLSHAGSGCRRNITKECAERHIHGPGIHQKSIEKPFRIGRHACCLTDRVWSKQRGQDRTSGLKPARPNARADWIERGLTVKHRIYAIAAAWVFCGAGTFSASALAGPILASLAGFFRQYRGPLQGRSRRYAHYAESGKLVARRNRPRRACRPFSRQRRRR